MAGKCGYIKPKDGKKDVLFCVEKKKHGYSGWIYSRAGNRRIPVHLGTPSKPRSLAQAYANGRAWLKGRR